MRNLWLLTRFLLKNGLGNNQKKNGKKKFGNRTSMYLILAVCFLPLAGMLFTLGKEMYHMFAPLGQGTAVVDLVCIAGACVFFLFGIATILSVFYMSTDVPLLLPFPLRPAEIVGAKWLVCLLNEYWLVIFFFLPILAGYGVSGQMGPSYWITMVLGCIGLPAVPLIYSAVLCMIIMRIFKNIRNKDILSYLGFGMALVLAIGIQFVVRGMEGVQAESMINFLSGQQGLIDIFHAIFPNLVFLAKGVSHGSFIYILFYYGTTVLIFAVFLLIAQKLYLPAVLGMSEATAEKRKLTEAEVRREVRSTNPVKAYGRIEWKKLYRTPVYFMNCVLMTLIWPVFFLVIIAVSVLGSSGTAAFMNLFSQMTGRGALPLFTLLRGDGPVAVAVLIVGCVAAFISMMCLVSSTAISRQGDNFGFMKMIPMSYEDQIRGLLSCGIKIGILGSLPYILLINLGAVIFGLHPVTLIYSSAITVLFVMAVNYQQLYMDIAHPKLEWETEAAAVKQNYRAMFSMLIDLAIGGALIGLGVLGYRVLHLNIHSVTIVVVVILAIVTWVMRNLLFTSGARMLSELEG